jgi:hypothetical protein
VQYCLKINVRGSKVLIAHRKYIQQQQRLLRRLNLEVLMGREWSKLIWTDCVWRKRRRYRLSSTCFVYIIISVAHLNAIFTKRGHFCCYFLSKCVKNIVVVMYAIKSCYGQWKESMIIIEMFTHVWAWITSNYVSGWAFWKIN